MPCSVSSFRSRSLNSTPFKAYKCGRGRLDTSTVASLCEKSRCKTCRHIIEGDSFRSNTTGKQYLVKKFHEAVITCATKTAKDVGSIHREYRMNSHRQRLSQMCDLFLYQHFRSDGHSEDDIEIMPVALEEGECMNLASKRRNYHFIPMDLMTR